MRFTQRIVSEAKYKGDMHFLDESRLIEDVMWALAFEGGSKRGHWHMIDDAITTCMAMAHDLGDVSYHTLVSHIPCIDTSIDPKVLVLSHLSNCINPRYETSILVGCMMDLIDALLYYRRCL